MPHPLIDCLMTPLLKRNDPNDAQSARSESEVRHQPSIIRLCETIVECTSGGNLTDESLKNCRNELKQLALRLKMTEGEALMMAVFVDQCEDTSIRLKDIARHFDCRNIRLMGRMEDIQALVRRGYVKQRNEDHRIQYRVPAEVVQCLMQDKPYEPKRYGNLSEDEFFLRVESLLQEMENKELTWDDFQSRIAELLDENSALPVAQALARADFSANERTILLFFCCRKCIHDDDSIMLSELTEILPSPVQRMRISLAFRQQRLELMRRDWITLKRNEGFLQRDTYCLTEKGMQSCLPSWSHNGASQAKMRGVKRAGEIVAKELFYNPHEALQVEELTALLRPEALDKIRGRLKRHGLRQGFAALFYGSPGTGKTETAYQLARQTGRDIYALQVEEIKSMWVGESEKNVKALFDRYRTLCEQSERTPILLFNEADALLGRRNEQAVRAVDKMENALQNIILQEMETLEGILIATTNLTDNLDSAFERRFLFKICFESPGVEIRASIWRSLLPGLTQRQAQTLAEAYPLSGGQIENVVRKRSIDAILYGGRLELSRLQRYCEEESLQRISATGRRIGFQR